MMGFKALVLVAVALCIGYVSATIKICANELKYFTCEPASLNYAIIFGSKVECPEKTMCNIHYIGTVDGSGSALCEACLPYNTESGASGTTTYTCTETGFKIGDKPFECPQYTKCEASNQFPVCKPQECTDKYWTCLSNGMVVVNDVQGYCKVGTKCNADYKYPCKPCIEDNDEGMDINPKSGASGVNASSVIKV